MAFEKFPVGGGGAVTSQFTAWCFYCARWDMQDVPCYSEAAIMWETHGWRIQVILRGKTKVMVCPHCAVEKGIK